MSHHVGARPISAPATQIETLGKLHASAPDEALLMQLDLSGWRQEWQATQSA
jgi:hypothetical protein